MPLDQPDQTNISPSPVNGDKSKSPDNKKDDGDMSFLEHLEELRWHLFRSVVAISTAAVVVFLAKSFVFDTVIFAPKKPSFPTYNALCYLSDILHLGKNLCLQPKPFEIINLEMTGQFLTHIKVSMILGLIISFPYLLWEIWRFIKPGLYENEMKHTRGFVIFCSLLFFMGVGFGYFIIVPFSVNFLVGYSISSTVNDSINLGSYIGYLSMIVMAAGMIFELPALVYFLAKLGLVGPDIMRKYRKHSFVAILILAAIITPPDVTSQILIAAPVYFLYELSIGIAARVEKNEQLKNA